MKYLKLLPLFLFGAYIIYAFGFSIHSGGGFTFVTIQQIQYKHPDSLALGRDKSDLLGDSVELIGKVVAPPRVSPTNGDNRTLLRGQNSFTCYLQDSTGAIFGGLVVRQGTRGPNTLIDVIDTGQTIKVRGVVQEFPATGYANSLTQVALDTAPGYTIEPMHTATKRPTPPVLSISTFEQGDYLNGGLINYVDGEKYEGMYVEFRNVTVGPSISARHPWSIIDDQGNKLLFRDFSNFFTTDPGQTLDTGYRHPSVGTHVNYIRGVIISANNTDPVFTNQLPYCIVPIYPNDVSFGNAPPILSSPLRNPGVPTPTDNVQVTVSAVDPGLSLTISEVRVFWRHNRGEYNSTIMPNVAGNLYSTQIPSAPLGTLVEYFFRAEDNLGASRTLPTDTSRSTLFYFVKSSDSMSIQEVQYTPNNGGFSAYNGYEVRGIEGIVTADTSDIQEFNCGAGCMGGNQSAPRRVMIQNGTGPWSGIWISGPATDMLQKGQLVRVSGTVEENFGVTRIAVPTVGNIVVISSGNPQPAAEILTTNVLANAKQDGDTTIEKWESVFVRINTPVQISCINASQGIACTTSEPLQDTTFRRNFGEIFVRDLTGAEARLELQDGNHNFTNNWDGMGSAPGRILLTKNDSISFVQGILYYSFGRYKLVPRRNDDFGTVTTVGITSNTEIVGSYQLSQNYPNPFNPVTIINFNIPVNAKVSLKIYDILGREMKQLVNQNMDRGNYNVQFEGSALASGVYFYSIHAEGIDGSKFYEAKRMVLVK
jgi:hypothetical protein